MKWGRGAWVAADPGGLSLCDRARKRIGYCAHLDYRDALHAYVSLAAIGARATHTNSGNSAATN